MQKAPERSGACLTFWRGVCAQSGGGGAGFLDCNFLFSAEPVFELVAVLPTNPFLPFGAPP
jgi:hypothetical protein